MENTQKSGWTGKFLDVIERVGNKLPHPVTIFALFALIIVITSGILSFFNVQVEDPIKGETITVFNLLSSEGIQYMFENLVSNFTGFAPLGTVLVTMLGIGIAERSGLISAMLRGLVMSVPKSWITAALVFAGIMSSMAADAGYVVLVPLGAVLFAGMGRHPLAGLAAAFAGVSAGFSANLSLTAIDPILADLTIEAVNSSAFASYAGEIQYTMNYYFMLFSVFLLTAVGTWVTNRIVEPRLGTYEGNVEETVEGLTKTEKKGLLSALIALLGTAGLLSLLIIPEAAPLRGEEFLKSPFFFNLVPVIVLIFFIPGFVYGRVTKTIKNDKDVANQMTATMETMGSYIVLSFAAAQFVAYFNQTNIGKIVAVHAANFLQTTGFDGIALIFVFIIVAASINMFMGSASAKWAIMAPVFVPIMMRLGYSPEFTTLIYRIADSTTNVISPLMTYFAIVIAFAQKYDKRIGIGTLVSTMLPYSIAFFIIWIIVLFVWMALGIPIGPGAGIEFDPSQWK
ncbi:aminobenzoyl-glutamate transporter [Pontibacillus halophilus JSM 076056 = DSM 19796]|uniref:Aminobenzoyl-glutamate transporter n=1 Tax=Pontibacillus halophilus JSM 076056 = DSM 19796 TaxID=1385510 RepID=A0A0A5GJH0_9BACI|nr:AbgT family transporter [Pontibacillus halophilus]KGX91363.1 aminobenzoyl-glutamate transporter [Pontibacillus halophilus JSM 076056 = DSM 19796]